ncbi:MAG: BON domain-containing protein [Steroidobacteraceae bacterium]
MRNTKTLLMSAFVAMSLAGAGAYAETAGAHVDDSVVTAKVKAALIKDPATKARQIDVETHEGTVQLNGFVDSSDAKMAAASVARGIEGVKSVDNNLEVRAGDRSAGNVVDDTVITTKVKTALIEDSRTKAYQIEVKTYKGVVSLGGFVDSSDARKTAANLAAAVQGVTRVDNGLTVK